MTRLVMIVDDELKIPELVRRYLEREGLEVLTTRSGAEAITMTADARPDLVVLDLGLPDVCGEEVARELRASSDVPILMLTARSDERDRIAGLELGADDYVTKPFTGSATRRSSRSARRCATLAHQLRGLAALLDDRATHPAALTPQPTEWSPWM